MVFLVLEFAQNWAKTYNFRKLLALSKVTEKQVCTNGFQSKQLFGGENLNRPILLVNDETLTWTSSKSSWKLCLVQTTSARRQVSLTSAPPLFLLLLQTHYPSSPSDCLSKIPLLSFDISKAPLFLLLIYLSYSKLLEKLALKSVD